LRLQRITYYKVFYGFFEASFKSLDVHLLVVDLFITFSDKTAFLICLLFLQQTL